ncbi:MAG: hypothetical protein O2901_13150, partial [Verrucomicrobia bacterium]|nr:hypothetical protein [Verrucomicrobiota bacterium]
SVEYPPITNYTENLAENQIESVVLGIRGVPGRGAALRSKAVFDLVLGKVLELVFRSVSRPVFVARRDYAGHSKVLEVVSTHEDRYLL